MGKRIRGLAAIELLLSLFDGLQRGSSFKDVALLQDTA